MLTTVSCLLLFVLSCPGGHEDWIFSSVCHYLNYVHDTFRFFYRFCRVEGSLSSVLLGTECMNGTKEYYIKRLKRGQKCPHRLILSFHWQSAKGRAGCVKAGRCCYLRRCFGGVPFALSEETGNSHHRPSRLARVLITVSCLLLFLSFSLSCPGGHEDWISILKCLSLLNYIHDTFGFFYKFCRVQGSLSPVLLGTECMNGTTEY